MGYEWTEPMQWDEPGAEPSDELKSQGFKGGYKPPASVFNYFLHNVGECIKQIHSKIDSICIPVPALSEDGVSYTATVEGITSLYNGLAITVVPNMTSTTTKITLDLNGLGAKNIRLVLPFNSGNSGALATHDSFFGADAPITLRYHEKMNCWKTDLQRQSAQALYGTVPIDGGGTGADTLEDAQENLGITPIKAVTDRITGIDLGTNRVTVDPNDFSYFVATTGSYTNVAVERTFNHLSKNYVSGYTTRCVANAYSVRDGSVIEVHTIDFVKAGSGDGYVPEYQVKTFDINTGQSTAESGTLTKLVGFKSFVG